MAVECVPQKNTVFLPRSFDQHGMDSLSDMAVTWVAWTKNGILGNGFYQRANLASAFYSVS